MLWSQVKSFTYSDLRQFSWDDLQKDTFHLLQEIQEKNINISPEVSEKLISLCNDTIRIYSENNPNNTILIPENIKNKKLSVSEFINIINFCFQVFKYLDDKLSITEKLIPLIKQILGFF